jgi:MscS family membrane protein
METHLKRSKPSPSRILPPAKYTSRLEAGACLALLLFLFCAPVRAQLGILRPAPAAPNTEVPKESLGRTTPRGTVLGFLTHARNGEDELAAQYLNTRLQGKNSAALAHQLFIVLNRRLPPRLNQISDEPDGSNSDPLHPDQELVGTVSGDNGDVNIFVERVDRGASGLVWLFSRETLESIPDLYDEVNVVSVSDVLPQFLLDIRLVGVALFEWIAVFLGLPLLYFLTGLLNRGLSRLIGELRRIYTKKPYLSNPELLPKPVRLLLVACVIHWLNSKIGLPLLARQFWSNTATVITIASVVWLLIHVASWAERYARRVLVLRSRNLTRAISMLRLTRWVVDLLIFFVGAVVTLRYFGVNATAALAGLGVGGIAVALAAQKTLENLIGGVSLLFDQAVQLGDDLQVGNARGIVEDIGLRSTRIRTPDRTLVSVPNGQIATMSLENFSSRDKFWFHPILALRLGASQPQISMLLDNLRGLVGENKYVEPASIRVRFLRLTLFSLDVEVFAYVIARDWNQFLEIQESLLLGVMGVIETSGVQFALPPQYIAAAGSDGESGQASIMSSARDAKAS